MSEHEFSRPVRVEPLPRDGLTQAIEADPQERAALARLNGLPEIAHLSLRARISKWRRGVHVVGDLSARLTQTCVVSLEPFPVEIDEPIDVRYLPLDAKAPPPEAVEDDDAPDPLIDGRIDLGALASEFLTLALDPYPRKPGVAFDAPADGAAPASPFAALASAPDEEELD